MDVCAHCGRKLLSHISARCNWCGGEIDDPEYQAQAEASRAAFLAELALHDLNALHIVGCNDPFAAGMIVPAERVYWQRRAEQETRQHTPLAPPPDAPESEPKDETRERFGHLEL